MTTSDPQISEKMAKAFYGKIWKLLIDARTKGKYDFKKGMKKHINARD